MEYTDYYVARGTPAKVRKTLATVCKRGVVIDKDGELVPFAAIGKADKVAKKLDWLLRVFDAEGSAWGFELWVGGKRIGAGTYGENAEWGIDGGDNGFEGDLEKTAAALGTTRAKLSKYLTDDGVAKFCKLVGFEHQYMLYPHEDELPEGIAFLSELT